MSRPRTDLRPIRLLLFCAAVSVTGDSILITGAPLLAASVTSDPFAVSLMTAAVWAPWLVVGLVAGALADRWPYARTIIVADLARAAVLALVVALVAGGYVHAHLAYIVAAAVFLVGCVGCVADSAMQAAIPMVLGNEASLGRANRRYWTLDTLGRKALGPLLGPVSFMVARTAPLVVDAVTFIVSAAVIRTLPRQAGARRTPKTPVISEIRAGLVFFAGEPELRMLSLGCGALNAAWTCSLAVLVLYSHQDLHIPTIGYGLLLACEATGGLLATARYPERLLAGRRPRSVLAVLMCLQAAGWLMIGLAHSVWVTGICIAATGYTGQITSVVISEPRQTIPAADMLGRVLSAFRVTGLGAAALGAVCGGLIARGLGLHAAFYASAVLLVIAAAVVSPRTRPGTRHRAGTTDHGEDHPGRLGAAPALPSAVCGFTAEPAITPNEST